MEKFYVTFGQKYLHEPHPHWPEAHPDGWVLIEASDGEAARTLAMSAFGPYWAFMYDAQRFDEESMKMRYYPKGEIGHITEEAGSPTDATDVPLIFNSSDPGFYGENPDGHLGNRVEGRLKPEHDPMSDMYDVEYFHDKCLSDGYGMFEDIFEVDTHVLNFEMDWANPWKCTVCGLELNK
jgi:hypothetical protein